MTYIAKSVWAVLLSVTMAAAVQAQDIKNESKKVKAVIKQLFDGMRQGNPDMVAGAFYENATLQTTFTHRKTGKSVLHNGGAYTKFVESIKKKKPEDTYDERISKYVVQIDDNLASVWTPYQFYLNGKLSHCGVNNFQLFKSEKGWKIISIIDTRRRKKCK
ncbi:nuclear transport factor 2 family protein [Microscilla marina]|uniref:Nuclear transport factor 2 family protein n=1 Tax=Microscilla marina ATCC 23134 TaxID=313606 RepID=A1ZUR0_MICM2|nr:nuclear transport factor 2 family protein [Microscilla marina]EAY25814.1 hypothetical protein M23134_07626 [Microscilla marina ATCC 23134]